MSNRSLLRLRRVAWLIGSLALVALALGAGAPVSTAVAATDPTVLAFFYTWYGPNSFIDEPGKRMSDAPITPYISSERTVMERQVREAKAAGIDGFISEWEGAGTDTDRNLSTLLEVAAAQNFQISIYVAVNAVKTHGDVGTQLRDVLAAHSGKPGFLHWQGRPVVFFWRPDQVPGGVDAWSGIRRQIDPNRRQIWSAEGVEARLLDTFDTLHLFSGGKWSAAGPADAGNKSVKALTDKYNKDHAGANRLWIAGVIPGWDERLLKERPENKYFDRRNGALYEESWQGAIATNPDLITITSWNEWYESTAIEPSVRNQNKYLDLTRIWTAKYKGTSTPRQETPVPPQPQPTTAPGECSALASPPMALPGTRTRRFTETGKTVSGVFLDYWEKHGGLPQQGFPISDVIGEVSLDGKNYTVQYFERAIFEYHPENKGTAFEVLLAQLGTYRYNGVYPNGPQGSWVNKSGGRLFNETGRWMAGAFRAYWEKNGQLAQQGFPISDEFQEQSLDGKTYTVQYFERAVFEYHPENKGTTFEVLLAQLGTYRYKAKYECK